MIGATMKDFFDRENIEIFIKNTNVRSLALFLFVVSGLGIIFAFLMGWIYGLIMLVLIVIGLYFSIELLQKMATDTHEYLNDLAYRIKTGEQQALLEMPIGILVFDDKDKVEWINPYLAHFFGDEDLIGNQLEAVEPELFKKIKAHWDDEDYHTIEWAGKQFTLLVQADFNIAYLMDVTKYIEIESLYEDDKLVLGNIYLDNYAEISQGMSDSDISNLRNYITSELNEWAEKYGLFIKTIDDDYYLILGHQSSLDIVEQNKFSILDVIRENTTKQNSPVTLSVGVAYGDNDLNKLSKLAQSNLDLALGRGGDQVVVKAADKQARFYGGKTNPMEKRTRVRARMISQALQELMTESDQIFVQGHRIPDMDSIGACLGIQRIAKMNNQECWIVLDNDHIHSDVAKLLEKVDEDGYQDIQDHIITVDQALEKATDHSLLIMVDHSKPKISMSESLFERLKSRVMIIDHHRRGEEFPENPILVYIEPYASSTCELIAEMIEYQPRDSEGINKLEATAMLTGIQVDTKSFTLRAGTRTFDAASYLRSAGADGLLIQELMKENVDSYMQRNYLISRVEILNQTMALSAGENDVIYDSVTTAQAADSLLTMDGIDASFVITLRDDHSVGISARSVGDFNVQVIMEAMGGGGHLSNAATQINDKTVAEVRADLIEILNKPENEDENEE
ncbi:DHH family phosphoesterase [Paucilactobacillus oligofermentans DSM 15707 = LMG 22743]|uniref:Cyclic-di-AMP phosphodiesterase n=2 Tax=Paucilactobacillus oligofermentans TaxID=293371 RepID=A0A0R1RM55_9LACO|nr:DHH family phosphoesterase [Paucilactobacillus oligofermentans DSM 15707 = LMG 22743]